MMPCQILWDTDRYMRIGKYMSEIINKKHDQFPPSSHKDMVDWVKNAFNCISDDTQVVSRSFDVCVIANIDSWKVRNRSFYKSCMENASKHFQNDEEEDNLFVLWFYAIIYLGSSKKKEKQKLKKLSIYFWVIENI